MYSIDISNSAKKFLKKVPRRDADIILNKLYSLRGPHLDVEKNVGQQILEIKDSIVIIDVIISGKRIIVLRIGYRKNIY